MVTSRPKSRSTTTSTAIQEKARQARQFIVNLWAARRKELTSSYQNLTEDTNPQVHEDNHTEVVLEESEIVCEPVTQSAPNVSGFAALGVEGVTGTKEVGNNDTTPENVELSTRRGYYYDSNKIEPDHDSNKNEPELCITTSDGGSVSQSNAQQEGPKWFDDKEWRLYYGPKEKKKKKKRKVVFHLDTEQKTIDQERYVQLEEEHEEKEDKRKKKGKKKKKVISTKAKKKAKRAGTVAWKGIKISWKYLKYGLIAMTEGPGSAFSTPHLLKAMAGTHPHA